MQGVGFVIARPIVQGLASGAAVGLVAVGLVLVYKSSRVFNFAAGEFVTLGAFGTYLADFWLPFGLAVIVGIATGAIAGLLTERLVVRPLSSRPKVTILVATVAIAFAIIPIEIIRSSKTQAFPARPIVHGNAFQIFRVFVSWQQLIIVLALVVVGAGLAYFFNRTDLGLATLASSQEPTATRLMGIRLNRISMLVWGMAGALGGLAGVLLPPLNLNFFAGFGTTDVLIAAFTAAVLGGMTSVPGAFVGGVLLGIVQAGALANVNSNKFPGAPSVAVLAVLVIVLVVRPTGLLGKEA
ncbi:MAG: livH 9 [Acidimicrobiales bacterium]|jgi:branched-chain amino acid transport system permease protein|nr:livH 9 [Acidimicrobiales bacterium]